MRGNEREREKQRRRKGGAVAGGKTRGRLEEEGTVERTGLHCHHYS